MFKSRRADPKPAKTIAGPRIDAFGRRVEPEPVPAPELTQVLDDLLSLRKVSPHARQATMIAKPRPIRPVLKTQYELPVKADQQRLWGYVAELPCQYPDCGVMGVQVAHLSLLEFGKGRSLKVPPAFVAALCPLHHVDIDSGKTMLKPERRDCLLYAGYRTMCELLMRGFLRPV